MLLLDAAADLARSLRLLVGGDWGQITFADVADAVVVADADRGLSWPGGDDEDGGGVQGRKGMLACRYRLLQTLRFCRQRDLFATEPLNQALVR